jgi:hypothetical protein
MEQELVYGEVYEVKRVTPRDSSASELADLLITGIDEEGKEISVRIKNFTATRSGFDKFQRYYQDSNF